MTSCWTVRAGGQRADQLPLSLSEHLPVNLGPPFLTRYSGGRLFFLEVTLPEPTFSCLLLKGRSIFVLVAKPLELSRQLGA